MLTWWMVGTSGTTRFWMLTRQKLSSRANDKLPNDHPGDILVTGVIIFTAKLRVLEVTLDIYLSFDEYISVVVHACSYHMRALTHIRRRINQEMANTVACSIILHETGLLQLHILLNFRFQHQSYTACAEHAHIMCRAPYKPSATKHHIQNHNVNIHCLATPSTGIPRWLYCWLLLTSAIPTFSTCSKHKPTCQFEVQDANHQRGISSCGLKYTERLANWYSVDGHPHQLS